jgi:uncharacterized membrane protein YccC
VARVFKLPEAYWAAISTLIVMQSSFGAALTVSARRFAGTALGAAVGALLATHFGPNVLAFGVGIFLTGLICLSLGRASRFNEYLDRTTYRYAAVALAITMLVVRYNAPWMVAVHRFLEVSIGIAVGLALTVLWPERHSQPAAPRAK